MSRTKRKKPKSMGVDRLLLAVVVLGSLLFGGLYWVLECVIDVFIFYEGDYVGQLLVEGNFPQRLLFRIVNPDPNEMWMRSLVVFIMLAFGIYSWSILASRRQMKIMLTESEEDFYNIAESIADGIAVMDEKGIVHFANPPAKRLFSRSKDDLEKKIFGFPVPRGKVAELEVALEGGEIATFEMRKATIEWNNKSMRLVSLCDISERKGMEEKIIHAAEEWRTTFDSITDLVSIHDKDFKIIRVNKAFAGSFKMKPNETIGKTCYELVHGTKEPWPDCPHANVIETQKPVRHEFFEPHLGLYLEVSVSPIFNEEGKVISAVHIVKDITERKKAEKQTQKHLHDLEVFYKANIGREERILDLKKKVKELEAKSGKKPAKE